MPTTANYGFYSPPLTGVTPNVPRDTLTLANAVDVALKAEETARIAGDVAITAYGERHLDSTQTLTNSVATAVNFNQSVALDGLTWDDTTKEFVVITAGRYQVNASITWAANATGLRLGYIIIGGATRLRQSIANPTAAGTSSMSLSKGFKLAVSDRVRISALQTSGGNLSLDNTNRQTQVDISYVGPAA